MLLNEKCKELLAVLFAAGEPLQQERAAQTVGIDGPTAGKLLQHVKDYLEELQLPFTLLRLGDSWQLATLEQYAPVVRQALEIRRGTPLSQAALEVLAIVAYNQPVTKSFVEQVRGVDSASVVNSLVEKGLLEEQGRLEIPGRPIAYGTSAHFLRCFSLNSLADLPPVEQFLDQEGDQLELETGPAGEDKPLQP